MALSDMASTKTAWRKAEIQKLLNGFSEKVVRQTMNEIISKEMNVSIDEARNIRTIKPSIVVKVLKEFECFFRFY